MASIQPVSSPTNVATSVPSIKEFRCTWRSCTKSFSRAEHLHRHALNHDETKGHNTCERCAAVFKRRDLLDRHMARHKEKDAEAGGEGLGKLQTRKRLWRDSNGTVVAKRRPELEKKSTCPRQRNKNLPRNQQDVIDSRTYANNHAGGPLSPPRSLQENTSNESIPFAPSSISDNVDQAASEDLWPMSMEDVDLSRADITVQESYDFLNNASWGTGVREGSSDDILYNDLFAPDTASSFNMPFTTMSYYHWLFGHESWPTAGMEEMNAAAPSKIPPLFTVPQAPPSTTSRGLSTSETSGDHSSNGQFYEPPKSDNDIHRNSSLIRSYSEEAPNPETSAANQILAMAHMAESNFAATLGYADSAMSAATKLHYQGNVPTSPAHILTPTNSGSGLNRNSPGQPKQRRQPPIVDEVSREAILSMISQAHPKGPDGSEISRDHPLLSLPSLQEYCDSYFDRFNISYPLLHQATFDPSQVDPLLLTAVLLLGATYGNKESHLIAVCIHDVLRAQIFGSPAFSTRPTLWVLQTILLVECFGKSRAGQLQHDMSHLFHGLLINLIRRSDSLSARCLVPEGHQEYSLDQRWRAEVEAEQKRRLALLCFMWDTQHAVLFSQSLCMNAAELKVTLPWNDSLWEAETAEDWHIINSMEQPQPQYLTALKTYISPRSGLRHVALNALSRTLMLHGLMSVAWDLNRRDQTSLGIGIAGKDEPWQSRIARSYDAWKSDFDTYSKAQLLTFAEASAEKEAFQKSCVAILAIYHAAHIILHVEINDLQINAGANHIIGRPVTKTDCDRSRSRIEKWANNSSVSAAKASSHAARILRDGLRKLTRWDAGDFFHYPWCLYLATLTCWTFQMCSKPSVGDDEVMSSDNEDSDWDARAEMNALVSAMTRANIEDLWKVAGKYRTRDLPRVMSKHLARVRWAVVQEGMIVLRGIGDGR